jgi:WD40 repeat protein
VFIWGAHTTEQKLGFRAHDDLILTSRFAPDGGRFVTAGSFDHLGDVWDSSTGALVATLSGRSQRVSCAAFSPDGNRILTGSADGTARIWIASTGQELWRSDRHREDLTTAIWSRTGSRILTASRDGAVCIWGGYVGPTW